MHKAISHAGRDNDRCYQQVCTIACCSLLVHTPHCCCITPTATHQLNVRFSVLSTSA